MKLLDESKSTLARYLFAALIAVAGLVATVALLTVSKEGIYAPLFGAVLLAAWYGGFGPAVLTIAIGWSLALWLVVPPHNSISFDHTDDVARWAINLGVAAFVGLVASFLRFGQERAVRETRDAVSLGEQTERLVQVTTALSSAVSSSDVARVLSVQGSGLVGAQGGALALVEGDEVLVVDPTGLAADARAEGDRLALSSATLLAEAARTGELSVAEDREAIVRRYPDSARDLSAEVAAALAAPVRTDGKVVASVGFLFDRSHAVTDETRALSSMLADLAGQALERARLYERELESRRALDRILQVAPRFLRDDAEGVIQAICREARTTFGADYGVLWRIKDDGLELLAIHPRVPTVTSDTRLELADFPRLREAIDTLGTSFIPDVRESTHGRGRSFVQELGIRSSLRTPVIIAGSAELVLAISWQVVISEPDRATLAVVRRFADQAGLALEQLERRRAQAVADALADSTRRLQTVTAALSRATTALDVSNTCLEHALESVGAEAGFVVLYDRTGTTVEIVSSSGYDDDELAAWRMLGLDDDVPFSRAMTSGEPVWALTPEEMAAFTGVSEPRSAGWATVPLVLRGGARGALHLSLRTPRVLTGDERDWLQAMVSLCSQALERSGSFEEEQRSRHRAERLQNMTGSLSNALTTADVARVVVDEVAAAVDADGVGVVGVSDGKTGSFLAWHGAAGEDTVAPLFEADDEQETPAAWAIRARRSLLFESREAIVHGFPAAADELAQTGQEMFLFVPLVAARRTNALLVATWESGGGLTRDDRTLVESLAAQAAQALDRAGHFESEQTIAETLQRSVLPSTLPRVEGVQLAARYLPGTAQLDVGGDWFDAIELRDGRLGLVVGDVVGKGVEAAASMAQLRNALRAFSVDRLKPSSVLERLNRLAEQVLETSFATVAYASLDTSTGVCRIASAGHPPPVVAFPDGRVEQLEGARGLPLGTGIESSYHQETVKLPAGAILVLYTDGLVERRGRSIDDGLADLRSAVATAPRDPDRMLEHVLEQIVGSDERGDDIALLAARVLPVAPRALELRVPVTLGSMELVRDAMRVWLGGAELERVDAEDVVLATWEACANAIEHATDPASDVVSLRAVLEDSRVRVVVEDSGRWTPPSPRHDRGLGLRLIHALSSSVDIEQRSDGTTVTLVKTLHA